MPGTLKLNSGGAGNLILTPSGSVGSDVTLTIPATTATLGIQGPLFSANTQIGVGQSVGHDTTAKVTGLGEQYDTNNNYSSSRFTPTVAGYYQFNGTLTFSATSGRVYGIYFYIYKNGSAFISNYNGLTSNSNQNLCVNIAGPIYCNGSTDYVELYVFQYDYTAASSITISSGIFAGYLVRAA